MCGEETVDCVLASTNKASTTSQSNIVTLSSSLEQFSEALTKLDLHSAYNLICIGKGNEWKDLAPHQVT